jgi:hypothetical protein
MKTLQIFTHMNVYKIRINQPASFCHQKTAWVMFRDFYLVKNFTQAKEKHAQIWNPQNFRNFFM